VRSRNLCFKWNATVRCMCIVELRVTVSKYWALRNNALWTIYVVGYSISLFGSSCKVPAISYPILTRFGVSGSFSLKSANIKLHVNPSIGSRADTCEQTDGHDEANRRSGHRWQYNAAHAHCMLDNEGYTHTHTE